MVYVILNREWVVMLDKKLQYLSKLPETDYPFISLYLNVNAHELFEQAEQNRIFVKNFFQKTEKKLHDEGKREKLQSFKNDSEKILDFLENKLITKAHGVAIFACEKLGIFEVFYSIMPFENAFAVNSIPHLKQLAYHFDECENALVIMTDKHLSRIFNVKLGGFVLEESKIGNDVQKFHKQGGWAQMRYQRHVENYALEHFKEVVKVATEMLDNNSYENVILLGQHYEMKKLEKLFPKRVKLKIIDVNSLDIRDNVNQIFEKIVNDLGKNESHKEMEAVESLVESSTVRTVTGMQDTLKLIGEGRVDSVIIPGYKTYQGWKCGGCLYVAKDQYQAGCCECNGEMEETDLIEEIVKLIFKNNGKLELVKDNAAEKLEEFEGIGYP